MGEEFKEFIDYNRDWRFHGFNHDMNDVHGVPARTALVALVQLDRKKKLAELGDMVLEQNFVLSPGMLHLSLLDRHIPANMVIAEVSTSFSDPLYIPTKAKRVWLNGTKSEEPYLVEVEETPGVVYTFNLSGTGLTGDSIDLFGNGGAQIIAFPDSVPTREIFGYFEAKFKAMMDKKNKAIDRAGKTTDITEEHGLSKRRSVRPSYLSRGASLPLPIIRGEAISQLELLAKLPRVFSIYIDKVENGDVDHLRKIVPTDEHFAYAEMEKRHGWVDDNNVEARARELAGMIMYVYVSQDAVFNPQVRCHVGDRFDLTTYLTKAGKVKQSFTSQMVLDSGCAYVDASKFMTAPLLTKNVIDFLVKREIDIETMGKFEDLA